MENTPDGARHSSDAGDEASAPPSYEAATTSNDRGTSSISKPFLPYTDEKTQLAAPAEASAANTPRRRGYSRGSTAERISCIAPSIPPGAVVLQAKCFNRQSQLILVLMTSTLLQVYDAMRDSLLWELHSNSGQLVQGNEEPFNFSKGFTASDDGTMLCLLAYRKNQRRLLVVDAESAWVKLEHMLSSKDGEQVDISPGNTKAVLCHQSSEAGSADSFKIFSLVEGQGHPMMRRVPYQKRESWQGVGVRFTPDGHHIIICTGASRKSKDTVPTVSISVYNEATGELVRSSSPPVPPKPSTSAPSTKFTPGFHFPSPDEWLVSFPDPNSPGKMCIMSARLGQTVAIFASELSLSQKWQVGVQSADTVQVAYDGDSGIFSKLDVTATLIPRGQTATITQFALSANGGRERAVVRKACQLRSKVISCKHAGIWGLSPDGLYMFVQQGGSVGKVDIYSVAL